MPKEKYYTSKTRRIIKLAKEKVDKYPWLFNEATVEREIIDPLLEALGWKFPNVRREVRLNGIKPQSFADYVLYKEEKPILIIEVKDIGTCLYREIEEDNNPKKDHHQLQDYFNGERYPEQDKIPVYLTNGRTWYILKWDNNICVPIRNGDWENSESDFWGIIDQLDYDNCNICNIKTKSKHPVTSDWVENEEIKILQNGNTLNYRSFILSFWDEIMNLQNEGLFDGTKVSKGSGAQKDIPKKSREKLENNKWSRMVYGEKRRIFLKQVLYGLNKKGKALDVEVKP